MVWVRLVWRLFLWFLKVFCGKREILFIVIKLGDFMSMIKCVLGIVWLMVSVVVSCVYFVGVDVCRCVFVSIVLLFVLRCMFNGSVLMGLLFCCLLMCIIWIKIEKL